MLRGCLPSCRSACLGCRHKKRKREREIFVRSKTAIDVKICPKGLFDPVDASITRSSLDRLTLSRCEVRKQLKNEISAMKWGSPPIVFVPVGPGRFGGRNQSKSNVLRVAGSPVHLTPHSNKYCSDSCQRLPYQPLLRRWRLRLSLRPSF